jgi:hypothetical protein
VKIIVLKLEIGSVCSKSACSVKLRKHMYLSKENHLCQTQEHLVHFFPVRVELVFERNTSGKS